MDHARVMNLVVKPAKVDTDSVDENAVLVFGDDRLIAILVRLDAPFHDNDQGCWNLEVGFGRWAGTPEPFETLQEGLRWVADRGNVDATTLADVLAEADLAFSPQAGSGAGFWSPP